MSKRVALITGGSRGIGFGIAQALAREGWYLAINGMRAEADVQSALKALETGKNEVIYCRGNVGEAEDRQNIIQTVVGHFGHLNVLVNNAGVAPKERDDLLDMSEASYDRVMNINLKGAFFLAQLAAKAIIKAKEKDAALEGAIINISSISATVVSVDRGQYCISKAGMGMVTQLFAARLGKEGISVFEVRPGVIATDMTSVVKEKYDRLFANGLAVQARWGTPEDVGKVVASLVRGDFPYSTGQVIMVDGGLTMQRL